MGDTSQTVTAVSILIRRILLRPKHNANPSKRRVGIQLERKDFQRAYLQIFIYFISFAGLTWAHPAFDHEPLISIKDIKTWVEHDSSSVNTVSKFLKRLPEAYRSHFVLQYASNSLHEATAETPRMIFFGPDSRLLMAVSGEPSDLRYNIIEFIEFNAKTSRYEFHELDFSSSQKPKLISNPSSCKNCHGSSLRPNWEPYDLWPGAYGTLHDTIKQKSQENAQFSNFLNLLKNSKLAHRYSALPDAFFLTQKTAAGSSNYYTASRGTGLNSTMSILTSFANRERIARLIIESPLHDSYRYAITAALIGCSEPIETFIPEKYRENHVRLFEEVLRETRLKLSENLQRKIHLSIGIVKPFDVEEFIEGVDKYGLREREVLRIAKLRYLLENRKEGPVKMDDWSLSLYRTSYDFNDGNSGLENLIGHYAPKALNNDPKLLSEVGIQPIPLDITHYEDSSTSSPTDYFKMTLYKIRDDQSMSCAHLHSKPQ